MGDRGKVIFTDDDGTFGYYSHWSGSMLKHMVADILYDNPGVYDRLKSGDIAYGYRGIVHGLLLKEFPEGVSETGSGLFAGDGGMQDGSVEVYFEVDGTVNGKSLHDFVNLYTSRPIGESAVNIYEAVKLLESIGYKVEAE